MPRRVIDLGAPLDHCIVWWLFQLLFRQLLEVPWAHDDSLNLRVEVEEFHVILQRKSLIVEQTRESFSGQQALGADVFVLLVIKTRRPWNPEKLKHVEARRPPTWIFFLLRFDFLGPVPIIVGMRSFLHMAFRALGSMNK